ncbi:MAG TPA: PEP-utilizing enzyme, partial [Candidatus Krumholzibacteria bacterium]|nr:PEP-utilizing enzyme [Candidatus Krumholzibacteria bacterium]
GKALAAGSAIGELCILPSAQSAGGPPAGAVLVVPLVLPADAIVFSRCSALICESGTVLGHAAVLAREKKIPALVLPGACSSLARVARVRVDGNRGEVEILSFHEEGASQ